MTQTRIEELERVRKEIGYWRGGAFAFVVAAAAFSVATLYSDAKGLVVQGPTQDRFVSSLQAGLNEHVVPRLRDVAGNALSEMQPVVQTEFTKLNERVPEMTEASLKQLDELEKNLPDKSEKVLQETLGTALKDKEEELHTMFPDVTEEQIGRFVQNLSQAAAERSVALGQDLLGPHLAAMKRIHANLAKIADTEHTKSDESMDDWQVGLAVFDVLRTDFEENKGKSKDGHNFAESGIKKEDKA